MLYEDPMRLAVRDPTVRAIAELAEHPWVMGPVGTPARQWAMSLRHEAGFEPDVAFESAGMLVHARLAAHGHAAAFLPDLVWFDRTPDVTLLEPASTHRRTILATVRSASGDHPLIHTMLAALRRAVEQAQASVDRHLGRTGR